MDSNAEELDYKSLDLFANISK